MKGSRILVLFAVVLLVAVTVTFIALASIRFMPPTQTTEQAIPDDQIPR